MRPPILVALLLLPITVLAQVTDTPPSCKPSQIPGGTGTSAITQVVDSPVVMCARWWCPPATGIGAWKWASSAIMPTYYLQTPRESFNSALESGDMSWMLAQRNRNLSDVNLARCLNSPNLVAKHEAVRPPTLYQFYVAPNLASTSVPKTRPVYDLVQGVRGTKEVGRAITGEGCNHLIARSGDYMAFAPLFDPTKVTLCKAQ